MDSHLERRLLACPALPTDPSVALDLLARCSASPADTAGVAAALARDPALAAKVLKIANQVSSSARGRIASVTAAAQALEPNALLALALSFSLALGRRRGDPPGLDLRVAWRRALRVAAASRSLAEGAAVDPEEAFAAGLLQDVGLLALREVARRDHAALCAEAGADHARLVALERSNLGTDHAEAGAFLARAWGLPAALADAIGASHTLPTPGASGLAACSALAGLIASGDDGPAREAARGVGIAPAAVDQAVARAARETAPPASAGDEELPDPEACERTLAAARETLVLLSFRSAHTADRAQETLRSLSEERVELEASTARDALTGLYNRAHGEALLPGLLGASIRTAQPLTVALADVDRFKLVNDVHGHATGDAVLRAVAEAVSRSLRATDVAVRWGGDEILMILPDTDAAGVAVVAERTRRRVAELSPRSPDGETLSVSLSLGHATASSTTPFASVGALVEAADGALYRAKRAGRNQVVGA